MMGSERAPAHSTAVRDGFVMAFLGLVVFVVSSFFDGFNKLVSWLSAHDTWQIDELLTVVLFLMIALPVYIARRRRELQREIQLRETAEAQRDRLTPLLEDAQSNLRVLAKLLPICAHCKKVRDDKGYWEEVDFYIQTRLDLRLAEGICPDCARALYGSRAGPQDERGRR